MFVNSISDNDLHPEHVRYSQNSTLYNVVSPHTSQNGHHQKIYKQ